MLALLSAHWPNFWDVLVNDMLGVTVQLMIACKCNKERKNKDFPFRLIRSSGHRNNESKDLSLFK